MADYEVRLALDIQYITFKPFVSGELFIFKPLTHPPETTAAGLECVGMNVSALLSFNKAESLLHYNELIWYN